MGLPAWLTLAYSARDAGDNERAAAVLRDAASAGHLEALVRLAMMLWPKEERRAEALIQEVESRVEEDDSDTHFALYQAYALGLTGEPDRESHDGNALDAYLRQKGRAFRHLKVAAELDAHPRLLYSVGLHYWQGLNGVERNDEEAERWLCRASRSGESDIVKSYKKFVCEQAKKSLRRET